MANPWEMNWTAPAAPAAPEAAPPGAGPDDIKVNNSDSAAPVPQAPDAGPSSVPPWQMKWGSAPSEPDSPIKSTLAQIPTGFNEGLAAVGGARWTP